MSQRTPLLIRGLGALARAENIRERVHGAMFNATEALLSQALTPDEKVALTVHLYDVLPINHTRRNTLFHWELDWYRLQLPAAPATILLGAAGDGREARWLHEHGYRVYALEAAPSCLAQLQTAVGDDGAAVLATYAELCTAVRGGAATPELAALAARQYDAVILGWGSFSHVLGVPTQRELMRAAHALCPEGPILASFFLAPTSEHASRSRAAVSGKRVGAQIARARGIEPPTWTEALLSHVGFVHVSSPEELEQHAAAIGRSLTLDLDWYPHGTFLRATGI